MYICLFVWRPSKKRWPNGLAWRAASAELRRSSLFLIRWFSSRIAKHWTATTWCLRELRISGSNAQEQLNVSLRKVLRRQLHLSRAWHWKLKTAKKKQSIRPGYNKLTGCQRSRPSLYRVLHSLARYEQADHGRTNLLTRKETLLESRP